MKVLLHICCAPCTVYPLRVIRAEGSEVAGFFYNPNIHPYTEFRKRREAAAEYGRVALLPIFIDETYDLGSFLASALQAGKDRCLPCYRLRLEAAFRKAAEEKADAVTTTLLYSIYQRHEAVAAVGRELSSRYGMPFLYRDFRSGWKEGRSEAARLGIYRQAYCGCIFSEYERFGPKTAAEKAALKGSGPGRRGPERGGAEKR